MDCREVREVADSFLSGQLLVETNHDVIRHLDVCPECRDEVAARRLLRARLKAAWANAPSLHPRGDFVAELRSTLRTKAGGVTRRQALKTWGAVAAGAAAAAGGAVYVNRVRARAALVALARTAAGDHQNCAIRFNLAERPIPLEDAGRRFGQPYAAMAGFVLPELNDSVRIIDRHSCVYDGRRFGHVVFALDQTVLSLLVAIDTPPAAVMLEPADGGPGVAIFPAGPYVGFVVGDTEETRLVEIAHALEPPLTRQLL